MTVTAYADLKWSPLDPKSPNGLQVSLVEGDMQKGPVTFFLKLPAGSKSPVHGHSNDYDSVVVQGAPTHSLSDKDAPKPLAVGSTWFQPGTELHFDSCTGDKDCVVLLHYPKGGFDFFMQPPAGAKATGKLAVTPYASVKWQPLNPKDPKGIQISMLAGDMQKGPVTFFMKFAAGGKSPVHGHSNDYYGIVTQGAPTHGLSDKEPGTPLAVGSTWFQPGTELHFDSCTGDKDCVVLLHYPKGGFDFFMAPEQAPAAAK
jgi:anti-sigma factor ChrR (cupin superfamily)